MINWIRKLFGFVPPDDVYFDALYLLDKSHSHEYHTDLYTVRKDACRLYVSVGYDIVFECAHKNTNPPVTYKSGVWVKKLQQRATAFRKMDARYGLHQ